MRLTNTDIHMKARRKAGTLSVSYGAILCEKSKKQKSKSKATWKHGAMLCEKAKSLSKSKTTWKHCAMLCEKAKSKKQKQNHLET